MAESQFYEDAYSKRGAQTACPGSAAFPKRKIPVPAGASAFVRNNPKGECASCGEAIALEDNRVRLHLIPAKVASNG